ncbi:MAG: nucleotidyltransferase domain-containing protein [Firmicutes bacterium]|nr:nucleotidyltransferase domain-containing protein [Bacillota bacterium]
MLSLEYLVAQDQGWQVIAGQGPIVIPQSLAGIAFGSRVYDTPRDDSDYDVGVVVREIPAAVEAARLEKELHHATALPVRVFWATPAGLAWKQTLDPVVFDVVHRGGLLWGSVEPW